MVSTGEWGEYFPTDISPFGYDETVAQEYFPMSKEQVKSQGWKWKGEEETTSYHGAYYDAKNIQEYDEKISGEIAQKNIDNLLGGILKCSVSGKPFKIIKQELAFYIENGIQIPSKHPDQRHKERMNLRNPRQLKERVCAECGEDMVTTYLSDKKEKVVCEKCYKKLVY